MQTPELDPVSLGFVLPGMGGAHRSFFSLLLANAVVILAAVSKRKPVTPDPAAQGDIPVPKFRRRKQESVSAYIQRMEQETQHVLFLTKNQLQREPETEEPAPEKSQRKKE